ncbi:retrovirus-related pol polyprotein from transposon TNT 1-94 [Tanacetum coccineum]
MTGSRNLFSSYKAYNGGNVIFGSNLRGNIIGKGTISNDSLKIDNVEHVDNLGFNLLSIGQICDNKGRVTFSEHDSEITKDGKVIGRGIRKKGLYVMQLGNEPKDKICLATINENSTLWHKRLGHANMHLIQSLASKELVRNLPKLKFDQHFYDACKIGKQAHASHKAKNIVSTTRCLKLLHTDLFDPSVVRSYEGNHYTLVIVDDYSRLVAQGYNQQEVIDYDETYAPVARLESIRILLAYACALNFKLFQMDVKSAFLNGFINKEVYVAQLPGFIDFEKLDHVYKLKKALYGLKHAPKAFSMSSNNASSAVTYTSVSSNSNGPSSWGISLENSREIPKIDPYEEVAQQGHAHLLSHAYVPDPMELDEHVPAYVPEPEHLEYHAPSDDDIQVEDQPYTDDASPTADSPRYIADSDLMEDDTDTDFIDYPNEPGTDDKDLEEDENENPKEDPSEEHDPEDEDEDPEEDPSEEHEPEDEDAKEDEPFKDSNETEPFEENETTATPPPPRHRGARISIRPQTPMTASTQALIDAFAAGPLPSPPLPLLSPPPINPTYDQAPLGHRAAMIPERFAAAAARAPRRQYDFVNTIEAGQGLIRSPIHDARTIARAADRAENVGYVIALQASEHRMMTSIEEVNLRVNYQIELHEVCQAYLSSKAQNRLLLQRLKTLETHMSRIEWQCQRAEDDTVRQIMRTQVLKARARIDTEEESEGLCNLHVSVPTPTS